MSNWRLNKVKSGKILLRNKAKREREKVQDAFNYVLYEAMGIKIK